MKEKKDKPMPVRCACGREAAVLVFRGKKMISCPDPENCVGNFRTLWKGRKEEAIAEWDNMIGSFKHTGR